MKDQNNQISFGKVGGPFKLQRRNFLQLAGAGTLALFLPKLSAMAGPFTGADFENLVPSDKKLDPKWVKSLYERGKPTVYRGSDLEKIGMPVGGICAGQLYLGGDGRLWHWDIFNLPQAEKFTSWAGPNYADPPEPESPLDQGFAIKVTASGKTEIRTLDSQGFKAPEIGCRAQYPMANVEYKAANFPVYVRLEAFSPFVPLNVDDSSLPATVMRFTVKNTSKKPAEVEIGGWLENAVCLGSAKNRPGRRRNRVQKQKRMTMLHCTAESLPETEQPEVRPEIVFEDFEGGYDNWRIEGAAFGNEPVSGTLPHQQPVTGFHGKRLVNSYVGGDDSTGRMISKPFAISRRFIAFLIGGGSHEGKTCINLLVDGKVVRTATGENNERLQWRDWNVSEFEGRNAQLEIVDRATGGWGHINVDRILFCDESPAASKRIEECEDYGSMGLALLGVDKNDFACTRLSGKPAEAMFAAADEQEAAEPFGKPLIGVIRRKLKLAPGATGEATFLVTWHFPGLLRNTLGPLENIDKLRRSYAKRFASAADVADYIAANFDRLAGETRLWNQTWYDSSLPYWFLDRTFIPICTLATSTCYQFDTGRFYAFEGVLCCQGTCQHVWNYAQSVGRIFPQLERDLRQRTDFGTAWHDNGAIDYRGECARHVAHDGQCGVILRAWREHQTAADDSYLRQCWPRIRKSIEYLIRCDADENGILEGEQYNTLDAAWYGPMAWISSLYIAALRAGQAMAADMGDDDFAARCRTIAEKGTEHLVKDLFNGEYFIHKLDPAHPDATNTNDGCHIDQLMGQAWALQVGLPRVMPSKETLSALESIWKYNFTPDVGPFRQKSPIKGGRWYAMSGEGGVLVTTFPKGGAEKATGKGGFAHYFNEVWTGQEHQLAAHMMWENMVEKALVITRIVHDRHNAARRNPFNEVECSDHYARAMSSYGTFVAACGFEYHGPRKHIGFAPRISPEKFRAPFTAAEGWGTFAQNSGAGKMHAELQVKWGKVPLRTMALAVSELDQVDSVRVAVNGRTIAATHQRTGSRLLVSLSNEVNLDSGSKLEINIVS